MFLFSRNTEVIADMESKAVKNAIAILERDRDKIFTITEGGKNFIKLQTNKQIQEEQYGIKITSNQMVIIASDDLGFIYGLLHISEKYLGIKPFWFWMDQKINQQESVCIEEGSFESVKPVVRFRGWFFNDEVLMLKWKYNEPDKEGWKMCFEALLRCGGNMVIPGTDKMSRENRQMASDMGLWITHHHAEPLGARMFAHAYPAIEPNYLEQKELFWKLWEEAVIEQKDCRVVWNLCFRGQGDAPFWTSDSTGQFDTPQKRGKLISQVIKEQSDIVRKYVDNPVFCTNLYGEIMELYEEGYIELAPDIIRVRADNGFGKMVTRRRGSHNPRVSSMPAKEDKSAQGIYYHVSFYDLQAANHITMLPNSATFVNDELSQVLANGGDDFWVINCSNVRPHVYFLDLVRKIWFGKTKKDLEHSQEFCQDYYDQSAEIARCYEQFSQNMPAYGTNEDEHMGEQFYAESIRALAHHFLVDKTKNSKSLWWITGDVPFEEQIKKIGSLCETGFAKLDAYYQACEALASTLTAKQKLLFKATLLLQVKIHRYCAKGVILFEKGYETFMQGDYEKAFVLFGKCTEQFQYVNRQLRGAEYGIWDTFYQNDCFADIKHTAYMVEKVMGVIREYGDDAGHNVWHRTYCCSKEEQKVILLMLTENHPTDWELYEIMKKQIEV